MVAIQGWAECALTTAAPPPGDIFYPVFCNLSVFYNMWLAVAIAFGGYNIRGDDDVYRARAGVD